MAINHGKAKELLAEFFLNLLMVPSTRTFSVLNLYYWEEEGLRGSKVPKGPRVQWVAMAKPCEWSIRCSSSDSGMLSGTALPFREFSTGGDIS